MTALRLGDRADLHRGDVGELCLQAASHGVPYLDAAVPGGEREEVRAGAEGGEEVADWSRNGRHGRRAAAGPRGSGERGFSRRRRRREEGFWEEGQDRKSTV